MKSLGFQGCCLRCDAEDVGGLSRCEVCISNHTKVRNRMVDASPDDKLFQHVKELYAMIKEIDRLHKEEREELLAALGDSGNIVDNLVGVIDSLGNELDEETLIKIGSVIATGQDVANVSESSAGIMYSELTEEGDLYISLTIPSLIVATYGGGTGIGTQRECLELLGCYGRDKVYKFAEIVGAVALAARPYCFFT